jgi:nicotinamide-nucleotide amidase
MVAASIITIGDELLIGQVIDTNSAWMATKLNEIGVWVKRRVAVGDNREDIIKTLDEESRNADIILITGGLGPTADDITKPLLAEYFGGKLVINEQALENVKAIFARLNRPMIERNFKQAEVPENCQVIQNKRGTAPGMWFEKNGKVYVSMPGVPHEMKGMMEDDVLARLPLIFKMQSIISRTLLTAGIGEAFLAEHIKDFENDLPSFIKLAYLPNYGMVRLRLTATGSNKSSVESDLDHHFRLLKKLVSEFLVTDDDLTMPVVTGRLLKQLHKTVATAESCTGGYIAHLLTSEAGASAYYSGSVVSYSNQVKQEVLHVSNDILTAHGAVSEQTVVAMAKGALQVLKTDYAIAVSGIMGPDGGTPEKPVGLVWIAVANNQLVESRKFNFRFDRRRNIELTASNALNLLRLFIIKQEQVAALAN